MADTDDGLDDGECALVLTTTNLDEDILTTEDADAEDEDIEADKELKDWVDDHDLSELTLEEHQQLQDHIHPVKMVLVKVCRITTIIYSPEINAS